ncbi:MAG: serine protease [Pseudomonadota bacterium]
MRIPDWIVFSLVLSVILYALFVGDKDASAPEPPPSEIAGELGPLLPDADIFEEEVLVQVGETTDGVGTAFALDRSGTWITARHVVDGCTEVGLSTGGNRYVPVARVRTARNADLAILETRQAPRNLAFDLSGDLRVGETGFHVGFPQGRSGEATSRLLARSRLVTRGRYRNEEPVLAWAEMGRTRGLSGTLAGMSGGPVFDADGKVVGVTVAESPRRGRIYTAAPVSLTSFLNSEGLQPADGEARALTVDSYGREADRLRRELTVVKVICRAEKAA